MLTYFSLILIVSIDEKIGPVVKKSGGYIFYLRFIGENCTLRHHYMNGAQSHAWDMLQYDGL